MPIGGSELICTDFGDPLNLLPYCTSGALKTGAKSPPAHIMLSIQDWHMSLGARGVRNKVNLVKKMSRSLAVLGLSTLMVLTSCGQPANLPTTDAVAIVNKYQTSVQNKALAIQKAKGFVQMEQRALAAQARTPGEYVAGPDGPKIDLAQLNWDQADVIPQSLYGEGTEVLSVPTLGSESSGENRLYVITSGELAGDMAQVNIKKDLATGNIVTTVIDLENGESEVWHRNADDGALISHGIYDAQGVAIPHLMNSQVSDLNAQGYNCSQLKSTRDSERRALRNSLLGAGAGYIAVIILICAMSFLSAGLGTLGVLAFIPEIYEAGLKYTRARNDYATLCNR